MISYENGFTSFIGIVLNWVVIIIFYFFKNCIFQEEIHELLLSFAEAGATVVRLKGGDPLVSGDKFFEIFV